MFFKFFHDTYDCDVIIQVRYWEDDKQIEINPDPLSESIVYNQEPTKGKHTAGNNIHGYDHIGKYEKINEIQTGSLAHQMKELAKIIKDTGEQRGE